MPKVSLTIKEYNNLSEKELGEKIKISSEQLEDILFGRIASFNLDELISYTEKLNGHLKLKININYDGELDTSSEAKILRKSQLIPLLLIVISKYLVLGEIF